MNQSTRENILSLNQSQWDQERIPVLISVSHIQTYLFTYSMIRIGFFSKPLTQTLILRKHLRLESFQTPYV